MKKSRFIWISLVVILAVSISSFAFADTLSAFKVVIDQIDISRNSGRTWVNIHSGAKEFNMIALRGGNATQFATVTVPAGTYNRWRVHLTSYSATVTGSAYGAEVTDSGSLDEWDSGDCKVTVDTGGNTSATWNFDAETCYTVLSATEIDIEPTITME